MPEPGAPQALLNKLMNTVAGFREKKNAAGLKYTDSSSQCLLSKDPETDFMDCHAEAMVFTSEKPTSTAFSVTLAVGESENEHRAKCNLILSIKERKGCHSSPRWGCARRGSYYGLNK